MKAKFDSRSMRGWVPRAALSAAAVSLLALVVTGTGQSQKQNQNQDDDQAYGISYMKISVGGHAITNFAEVKKYAGWLAVENVMITLQTPPAPTAEEAAPNPNETPEQEWAREGWEHLDQVAPPTRVGPGRLNFGSGDDGTFDPMIDAQKRGAVIPSAELALYATDGGRYLGRFKIRGIRVLSVEPIQASACPMDDITLSFRSITKE